MHLLDTNVYLALYFTNEVHHPQSKERIETLEGTILLPHLVFSETVTLLTCRHSKALADIFVKFVETDNRFLLIHEDRTSVLTVWKHINLKISYVDVALVAMAIQYNAQLLSYDQQLNRLYRKILSA